MALSLNSEDKLRMSIGGDWSAIATAFGASELSYGLVMQLAT
jgi:hypothetical protein